MSKLYLGNKLIIDPDLKLEKRVLTQKDYDNLSTKQNNVIYVVTDAPSPFSKLVEVEDYLNTHINDEDIHVPTEREKGQLLSVDENDYLKWRNLDKSDVGLDKVDNTSDLDKPISKAVRITTNTLWGEINGIKDQIDYLENHKGKPNGLATLDSNGKIPTSQLPNNIRSSSLTLGETTGTAYDGAKGKKNADDIIALTTTVENKINKLPYIVEIDNCEIEKDTLNNYIIATLTLSENSISIEELSQIASDVNSRAKFIIEGNLKVNKAEEGVNDKIINVYVNGLISQKHGILQGIVSDSSTTGSSSYIIIETAGFSVNNNIITLKYRSSVV